MADDLLQQFWGLSSKNEEERLISAHKILTTLSNLQCPSYSECNELQYCIQRLIKGLASNREGARHGYFITLVEILKEFAVPLAEVFKCINESLGKIGNAKAQEERGIYFGRLFAYLAVIESGKINDNTHIKLLTKSIMTVYNKKSFLQEFSVLILHRLMDSIISSEQIIDRMLPYLQLDCGWEKCTPDKLYVLLKLQEHCEGSDRFTEFLSLNWNNADLVSEQTLSNIAEVLLVSSQSHPQIHVVWPVIINKLRGKPLWRSFWTKAVTDSLMTSTHERKYLCYQLMDEYVLPSLTIEEVDVIFCSRLLQQLENNSSTKHHLLHDAAKHFLKEFPAKITDNSKQGVSLAVAMHLNRYKSATNVFSDAIRNLLQNVSVDDVNVYVDYLINYLWTDTLIDERHLWIIQEISMVFKLLGTSLKRHRSWLVTLAKFLLLQSHFDILKPSSHHSVPCVTDPISTVARAQYCEILNRTFSFLSDLKCIRVNIGEPDGGNVLSSDLWPVILVMYVEELKKAKDFVNLIRKNDDELWDRGMSVVIDLYSKDRDNVEEAFIYLISVLLLDMLKSEEKTSGNLEEILTCYQRRISSLKKTPKRRKSIAPSNNSSGWLPVLMDVMLGLLSVGDLYWRSVCGRVFLWLKGSLTTEAMEVIVKAIQPQNIDELMEQKDNNDEEDSGDSGDDTGSEDVVFHDVGAEFRANVQNALGDLAAVDSDQESVTSMDVEEMDVVDNALAGVFLTQKEKLMEKKQNKTDKTSLMHFKMRVLELVEVYTRHQSTNPLVMELLDPLLSLVFKYNSHKVFAPLSERARNLLDKLCRVKSYPREGIDVDGLHAMLQQLITKRLYSAQRLSAVVSQCSMFLIRVLKGTHKHPTISPLATRSTRKRKKMEEEQAAKSSPSTDFGVLKVKDVVEWCSSALVDMISDKNCNVQPGFFIMLSERQPEISLKLLPSLKEGLKQPGNHFHKMQGCTVLEALLSNSRKLLSDEEKDDYKSILVEQDVCH